MMTRCSACFLSLAVLVTLVASPSPSAGAKGDESAAEADTVSAEPTPVPTPAVRSFDCRVDAPGERCTVPIDDAEHVEGVVAYHQENTGKWVDYGRGPFDREGRPDGCGWVLQFRERLVEERGCFVAGKRNGPWETCLMRLDQPPGQEEASGRKCPTTEYAMGVVVVKPKEPEPERIDDEAAPAEDQQAKSSAQEKKGNKGD